MVVILFLVLNLLMIMVMIMIMDRVIAVVVVMMLSVCVHVHVHQACVARKATTGLHFVGLDSPIHSRPHRRLEPRSPQHRRAN